MQVQLLALLRFKSTRSTLWGRALLKQTPKMQSNQILQLSISWEDLSLRIAGQNLPVSRAMIGLPFTSASSLSTSLLWKELPKSPLSAAIYQRGLMIPTSSPYSSSSRWRSSHSWVSWLAYCFGWSWSNVWTHALCLVLAMSSRPRVSGEPLTRSRGTIMTS